MGNHSYLIEQTGCEIDNEKLKEEAKKIIVNDRNDGQKSVYECYKDEIDSEKFLDLGGTIDAWKIQGYWYKEFCGLLRALSLSMKNLTEDEYDNYIKMEEEQGFPFYIEFFLRDGKPSVRVRYVPMEWEIFDIDDKWIYELREWEKEDIKVAVGKEEVSNALIDMVDKADEKGV